jgi:hypothetical protein
MTITPALMMLATMGYVSTLPKIAMTTIHALMMRAAMGYV